MKIKKQLLRYTFCDETYRTSKTIMCAGLNVLVVCAWYFSQLRTRRAFQICIGVKTAPEIHLLQTNGDLLLEGAVLMACSELYLQPNEKKTSIIENCPF